MQKRKRRPPSVRVGLTTTKLNGQKFHAWQCRLCGDQFGSFTRDLVARWAIRHLNHHLRTAIVRSPSEAMYENE
jgi:hypothetical protein